MSFKKTILLDVLMDISKFAAASASMITKTTAMQKAMGAFSKALMGVFAAKAIFNGINNQIKVIGEFERAMSRVQAVAGATSGQMYFLTENAKQLGLSTRFTASEVAELSNELAKLGFSTDQILKLSKATLNLASISNASLADSARIVGSTIRAFNKDATESTHVVDVMAVAFTNSALDLEKFRTGMSIVAPVATQAGLSIEQTTAMLAQLADRGIDASMAGTGLRGILLDLSRHGLTMQQAFDKINNATDKNAMAFDLFGKRGATVATILAGTTEEIDKLSSSLINSLGAADKMSAVIEDNLIGDQKKLKSAWEALVLEGGILIPVLRSITQAMTAIVQSFNELAAERAKIAVMDKLEAIRNQQNIDLLLEKLRIEKAYLREKVKESQAILDDPNADSFVKQGIAAALPSLERQLKNVTDEIVMQYQLYSASYEQIKAIETTEAAIAKSLADQRKLSEVGGVDTESEEKEALVRLLAEQALGLDKISLSLASYNGFVNEADQRWKGVKMTQEDINRILQKRNEIAENDKTLENFVAFQQTMEKIKNIQDVVSAGFEGIASIIDATKDSYRSFGEKVIAILMQTLKAVMANITAWAILLGITAPEKLVLGLTIAMGVLTGINALVKPRKDEVQVVGSIHGNDIYLSNARTENNYSIVGGRIG